MYLKLNSHILRSCRRKFSQKAVSAKRKLNIQPDAAYIRNIGILAHIDAGL